MNLEFRQLEVFCEVVRLKSFIRASQKVHLSQASVSERITALEEQVGARLLDRSQRHGVRPTPIGLALYEHAVRLLDNREHAVQELRDFLGLRTGTLKIAASNVPGTYYLPALLRTFSEQHPAAHFSVTIAGSEQVVDMVVSGSHELGIAGDPGERVGGKLLRGQTAALRAQATLWADRFVLAVPPGHAFAKQGRIPPARLTEAAFVMREPGSSTRRWFELFLQEHLRERAAEVKVVAEVGTLCAVKQAVIHGIGVSVVSACAIATEVRAGILQAVEIEGVRSDPRHFHLVRDDRRTMSPLARMFVKHILEATAAARRSG